MALSSRLQKNDLAFVLHEPPLPNRVRTIPSTQNSRGVGWLPPGVVMTITDGQVEANGLLWWKIQSDLARLTGWTPERDESSFFLGPVEERALCTHAVRTLLHKGDGAVVISPRAIHVRQTPSFEGVITDEFATGTALTVVDGPLCANEIVWWNIRADPLPAPRWIAEGQAGQRFLIPTSINKNGVVAGHYHEVKAGETWGSLAQRFKTTAMVLQTLNPGLKRPGLVLRVEDRLWIPGQ